MPKNGKIKIKATVIRNAENSVEVEAQTAMHGCSPAELLETLALVSARNIVNIAKHNPISEESGTIGHLVAMTTTMKLFMDSLQTHLHDLTKDVIETQCECPNCQRQNKTVQ